MPSERITEELTLAAPGVKLGESGSVSVCEQGSRHRL
jgi:hypothetical protein